MVVITAEAKPLGAVAQLLNKVIPFGQRLGAVAFEVVVEIVEVEQLIFFIAARVAGPTTPIELTPATD